MTSPIEEPQDTKWRTSNAPQSQRVCPGGCGGGCGGGGEGWGGVLVAGLWSLWWLVLALCCCCCYCCCCFEHGRQLVAINFSENIQPRNGGWDEGSIEFPRCWGIISRHGFAACFTVYSVLETRATIGGGAHTTFFLTFLDVGSLRRLPKTDLEKNKAATQPDKTSNGLCRHTTITTQKKMAFFRRYWVKEPLSRSESSASIIGLVLRITLSPVIGVAPGISDAAVAATLLRSPQPSTPASIPVSSPTLAPYCTISVYLPFVAPST